MKLESVYVRGGEIGRWRRWSKSFILKEHLTNKIRAQILSEKIKSQKVKKMESFGGKSVKGQKDIVGKAPHNSCYI